MVTPKLDELLAMAKEDPDDSHAVTWEIDNVAYFTTEAGDSLILRGDEDIRAVLVALEHAAGTDADDAWGDGVRFAVNTIRTSLDKAR